MILAIGNDLVRTERVRRLIDRFGERFLQRLFTSEERAFCEQSRHTAKRIQHYACRFAAKEACFKALAGARRSDSPGHNSPGDGTPATRRFWGVHWKEFEVVRRPGEAPSMRLHGKALAHLHSALPSGKQAQIHLALSDDDSIAQAFIVISAR